MRFCLSLTVLFGGLLCLAQFGQAAEETAAPGPSVTIYPVKISPDTDTAGTVRGDVASVIGLMLERAGLEQIELSETEFDAKDRAKIKPLAQSFGQFVQDRSLKTDYALYVELIGTPGEGVDAIRTLVVDAKGQVVLAAHDDQESFANVESPTPKDPMSCCLFVANRLRAHWELADPMRADAPQGKIHEQWNEKSGLPPKAEIERIGKRLETLKKRLASEEVTLTVLPIRVGKDFHTQPAEQLAELIIAEAKCMAVVSDKTIEFETKANSNEQRVLWDTARSVQTWIRKEKPKTDYILLADYGIWGQNVGYVHLILCDKQGDWVLLDYQNSHHADFERLATSKTDDCNRLALERLGSRIEP